MAYSSITKQCRKRKKEDLCKIGQRKMTVLFKKFHTIVNLLPQKHENSQDIKIVNTLHYDGNLKLSHSKRKQLTDEHCPEK